MQNKYFQGLYLNEFFTVCCLDCFLIHQPETNELELDGYITLSDDHIFWLDR